MAHVLLGEALVKAALTALALLTALSTSACSSGKEETLVVHDYIAPCQGVSVELCLVTGEGATRDTMYGGIRGFSPKWGVTSRIRVEVKDVEDPPADGSSVTYTLIEVLDERPVDPASHFELVMQKGYATPSNGGFRLLGGREFVCDTAEICNDIAARLETLDLFIVEFRHPDVPTDTAKPLVALAVRNRP